MTRRWLKRLLGKVQIRACLRCDRLFKSEHRFHRLCARCAKEIQDMPEDHRIGE